MACHFQGGVGGGGELKQNVNTYRVVSTAAIPQQLATGLIHNFATHPALQESLDFLRKQHPIVPERTKLVPRCGNPNDLIPVVVREEFDPLQAESINTTALFGAGWIDRISDRTLRVPARLRGFAKMSEEFQLKFRTVPVGRFRELPNGAIGKFGWKGQFATLDEFVAAACANEIGLGNPRMKQAVSFSRPDYVPTETPDLDAKQFASLVAFVDTLPRPEERQLPTEPERMSAKAGKKLFELVGCALCHTPDIGGVTGVYSDFMLYDIVSLPPHVNAGAGYGERFVPPEDRKSKEPLPTEWKTPPLWGVADSAPYFHDGGSPTLHDAIQRHQGDAILVTEAYNKLDPGQQQAILDFLRTLRAPKDAAPVPRPVTVASNARP